MPEGVNFKNRSEIRAKLSTYLIDVRKTKQDLEQLFIQTENYEGVYVPFNPSFPINDDKSAWDFDYFIDERTALSLMFSKKRMLHLMEVREYLRQNNCEELIDRLGKNISDEKIIEISRAEFIQLYPNLGKMHYLCKSITLDNGDIIIIKENNRVTKKFRPNK